MPLITRVCQQSPSLIRDDAAMSAAAQHAPQMRYARLTLLEAARDKERQ